MAGDLNLPSKDELQASAGEGASAPPVDPAHFRRVLGQVATSVAIVTGVDDDGPFGMVIGSLVSISLDPPLVGLFVDDRATTLPRILESDRLCISVLAASHAQLCQDFGRNRQSRFQCGNWIADPDKPPRLSGALAWIVGPIERAVQIGDHVLIVVEASELIANEQRPACEPLVFFQGGFVDSSQA